MTAKQALENSNPPELIPITDRCFAFAVRIVKLCKFLERHSDTSRTLINQLLDAGTSVGANLEEAVAGQSKADFIHKNAIALKEAGVNLVTGSDLSSQRRALPLQSERVSLIWPGSRLSSEDDR